MSSFELESRVENGRVHVDLAGELDLTSARELELRLDEVAPADTPLLLNLNGVTFLDSAALHVLFKLIRQRGHEDVTFVVDPEAHVASVLAIVGLPDVATVQPSTET